MNLCRHRAETVILDLPTSPGPENYDAFNVCVTCSRARGRTGAHFLSGVDYRLTILHPCTALHVEDKQLANLDADTKR